MKKPYDPIELELFKNIFVSISEEMGAVLGRTALSPNIKERKDFSCALFTAEGETFAQGAHIPVHLGAMPLSVKASLQAVHFKKGDCVVLNDPYKGGTHLPDITLVSPVFIKEKISFFVANRAHHSDVGGMSPGSMPLSTEIFQEGLIIPPIKLIKRGSIQKEILDMIMANVRTPEERKADIMAQIASNYVGQKRLQEVANKFGFSKIRKYASLVQDYTEIFLRKTLRSLPNGTFEFMDKMDDDGISSEHVPIHVRITIKEEEAIIDFTGSSPQVKGCINANLAVTTSAVMYVFRSLIEEDIPFNTGLIRPIEIIAPPGSIVNAQFPSATAGGNVETSQRIVDVLLGALYQFCPEKIPAASSGTMNNIALGGFNKETKTRFTYYETIGGGMGASMKADGLSGVHTHMTNSLNTPLEAIENYLPLRVNTYSLRRNSGGRGKTQGGEGLVREYEFLIPTQVSMISERRRLAPYGLRGGQPGKKGRNTLISRGKKVSLPSKFNITVMKGDVLRVKTPGGGGYGKKP